MIRNNIGSLAFVGGRDGGYSSFSFAFHLTIGRNLRRQMSVVQVKANIVVVMNQIKHGLFQVDDPDEKDDFARLFLRASRQVAKS